MTVDLLEDVYEDFRDDGKIKKIRSKLKEEYKKGGFERAYLKALVDECVNIQPLDEKELKLLASLRADVLRSYLVDKKGVELTRVKILESEASSESDKNYSKTKLEIVVQ